MERIRVSAQNDEPVAHEVEKFSMAVPSYGVREHKLLGHLLSQVPAPPTQHVVNEGVVGSA